MTEKSRTEKITQLRKIGKQINKLYKKREFTECLALCDTIVDQDILAKIIRANCLYHLRRYEECIEAFHVAITNRGKLGNYDYVVFGLAYYYTQNYGKAILYIEKSLSLKYVLKNVLHLCKCYIKVDDHERAIGILTKVIEEDPKEYRAYFLLGMSYKKCREFGRAQKAFEIANKLCPEHPVYIVCIGQCLMQSKQYFEARRLILKARAISPNVGEMDLANCNMFLGDYADAIKNFTAVIETAKYDVDKRSAHDCIIYCREQLMK